MRALRTLGPRRRVRRQPPADPRAERGLSAGAGGDRRLLQKQESRSGPRGRPAGIHRAGDRHLPAARRCAARSCTAKTSCTWRASTTSRRWCAALRSFLGRHAPHLDTNPGAAWLKSVQSIEGQSHSIARRAAGAAADVLRRLPGAPGVLGDEAGGAGHRPAARFDGRRLPRVRELRAVLAGQHPARLRHEPRCRGGRRTRCRRGARCQ